MDQEHGLAREIHQNWWQLPIEKSLGLNETLTTSDIRKELFESENVLKINYFLKYRLNYFIFRILVIFNFFAKIDIEFEASNYIVRNIKNSISYKTRNNFLLMHLNALFITNLNFIVFLLLLFASRLSSRLIKLNRDANSAIDEAPREKPVNA